MSLVQRINQLASAAGQNDKALSDRMTQMAGTIPKKTSSLQNDSDFTSSGDFSTLISSLNSLTTALNTLCGALVTAATNSHTIPAQSNNS